MFFFSFLFFFAAGSLGTGCPTTRAFKVVRVENEVPFSCACTHAWDLFLLSNNNGLFAEMNVSVCGACGCSCKVRQSVAMEFTETASCVDDGKRN